MAKNKTRAQKIKTSQSKSGYTVSFDTLSLDKKPVKKGPEKIVEAKYFRSDLTKVFVLTMLALALEFALWIISKR